jgi:hypothetical protein
MFGATPQQMRDRRMMESLAALLRQMSAGGPGPAAAMAPAQAGAPAAMMVPAQAPGPAAAGPPAAQEGRQPIAAPKPAPAPPRVPFGAGPAARAIAPAMQAPPKAASPTPAAPVAGSPAPAPAPKPAPLFSGPLAMEQATAQFEPRLSWAERLQLLGATLSQMGDPQNQIAAMQDAITGRQRAAFSEQQSADSRRAMIAAVRRIATESRAAHESSADGADPDAPAPPPWETTPVAQMLRLAQTPEQFLEWYVNWQESEAGRTLQRRGLDIEERGTDARIAQGERGLELQSRGLDLEERFGGEAARDRDADRAVAWFNAQTQRQAMEAAEAASGGRDPWSRAMMQADVALVQEYEAQAQAAQQAASYARRLEQLLASGLNTGALAVNRFGWGAAEEEWRSINNALFPVLGEAVRGVLSETDAQRVMDAQPQLGKSETTNRNIINSWRRAAERAAERAHWARIYGDRDRSLTTFNRLWSQYTQRHSIYDAEPRSFADFLSAEGAVDDASRRGSRRDQPQTETTEADRRAMESIGRQWLERLRQ